MLSKITHNLTIIAGKKLLDNLDPENLNIGKSLLSIIAGAYIFQKGIKNIYKHPVIGFQEAFLGGYLLYDSIKGIRDGYIRHPTEVYQVRKNQIQGNDPNSAVPAFV